MKRARRRSIKKGANKWDFFMLFLLSGEQRRTVNKTRYERVRTVGRHVCAEDSDLIRNDLTQ